MKKFILILLVSAGLVTPGPSVQGADLPNILWIVAEDINPQLGCYGDTYAQTPNLDRFAARSLRYNKCWSTAPVCAPARTTLITGVYPTSTGAEHMRSLTAMPEFMRMYPQLLRERGYYCVNKAKEDYNLEKSGRVWDESSARAHYKNRKPGQPFFAAFNMEVSHESQIRVRPHTLKHDPAKAPLPPYHPDTPEVRHDWAQYYDKVTEMDAIAGRHLKELEEAGLAEDTIVFFYGDNGCGMPRSKRWPYNSGLHVPLLVHIPEKFNHLAPKDYKSGGTTDRLVAFVDFAPTLLSIAGAKPPDWMQGHAFMGQFNTPPQSYLYGFSGRMDERYDMVRSVRDARYIYIRNYMPHLVYGQYLDYMFQTPTTRVWKKLYDDGKLVSPQTFFWETKPAEELYDLQEDPWEVKNLANSPTHQTTLAELRQAQRNHALVTRDIGFLTESEQARRASGIARYDLGHDPSKFPIEKILAMAEVASSLRPDVLSQIKQGLQDEDSGVRYWAALGFLMRGAKAVEIGRAELQAALNDKSPSVRIAAARGLGQYGDEKDLKLALPVLAELAPPDKNGPFTSLEALTAIDALAGKADSLLSLLKTMPPRDPKAQSRNAEYSERMLKQVLKTSTSNPRPAAQLQSSDDVQTTAGWIKYQGNPVMGGKYGTCFDVSVLKEPPGYRMWLSWRPKKSVALVESKDGIQWSEPPVIVLGPRAETDWEEDINRPVVVKRPDGYHMWYTGQAKGHSSIGYATSPNGINWKRMSDKPVLAPEKEWEKVALMCPHVLWDDDAKLFRMWYSGGDQYEPDAIGNATSADGLHWNKSEQNPIFTPASGKQWEQHKVTAVQVIKQGSWHLMFYIGFRDVDHAQIGLARSRDGLSGWQRHPANPIIRPGKEAWDHDACYKPYAIYNGEKWLLWYNGRHGGLEQIGVALHPGLDLGF